MPRRRCLIGCVASGVILVGWGCGSEPPPTPPPDEIRLSVGSRGGDFWSFGTALAAAAAARQAHYRVAVSRAVGLQTLEALNSGQSDCGFAYANLAYEGFSGKLQSVGGPLDQLRGVASVEVTPLNLTVLETSTIRRVEDLAGKRVMIGDPDSGSFRAARLLLDAYGLLDRSGGVELVPSAFYNTRERLLDGSVDAVLQLRGRPPTYLEDGDLRLVSIQGSGVDALRQQYPFFRPALVPAGSYRDQEEPVLTVGIDSVLLCREGTPPEVVRSLTVDWFGAAEQLVAEGLLSEAFSRRAASVTPIPLHQGARDYYRARQVLLRD